MTLLLAACWLPAQDLNTTAGSPEDEAAKEAELVKKTFNPVASLISVPIRNNWDFGIGPANAMRYTANIQPVIPFSLPFNISASRLLKVGKQPLQLSLGAKYYTEGPKGGPDWGLRFAVTFLFPK